MSGPVLYGADGHSRVTSDVQPAPDFGMRCNYSINGQFGTVLVHVGGKTYAFLPEEAKQLGVRLIAHATKAISDAVALRIMTGEGEMMLEQAIGLLNEESAKGVMDHDAMFVRKVQGEARAFAEQQAMGKPAGDPQ